MKSGNTVTENISKALKEGMAGMVELGPIGMTFGADPTPEVGTLQKHTIITTTWGVGRLTLSVSTADLLLMTHNT